MDTLFFRLPFALSGDKVPVPMPSDPGGAVSYDQGFGPDYERDQTSDPLAKNVPRDEFNQLLFDITSNLRQYQSEGFPQWIAAADNAGVAFPYRVGACVAYDTGGGVWKNYISLIDANTSLPTVAADWQELTPFVLSANIATLAEAQAGTDNTKVMTPLRVAQAVPAATTTTPGRVELATTAEVTTGTDTTRAVTAASLAGRTITAGVGLSGGGTLGADRTITLGTPSTLNGSTINSASGTTHTHAISAASTTVEGVVELATTAEVTAGTDTTRAITPAGLAGRTITAGNGLSGGGTLDADRTITLGTPSSITSASTNSVGAGTHSHAISPASTSTQGIVELATRAEANDGLATALAVTPDALEAAVHGTLCIYTGNSAANVTFPPGTSLWAIASSPPDRAASVSVYNSGVGGSVSFTLSVTGSPLTGTWRARGYDSGSVLVERTN